MSRAGEKLYGDWERRAAVAAPPVRWRRVASFSSWAALLAFVAAAWVWSYATYGCSARTISTARLITSRCSGVPVGVTRKLCVTCFQVDSRSTGPMRLHHAA